MRTDNFPSNDIVRVYNNKRLGKTASFYCAFEMEEVYKQFVPDLFPKAQDYIIWKKKKKQKKNETKLKFPCWEVKLS